MSGDEDEELTLDQELAILMVLEHMPRVLASMQDMLQRVTAIGTQAVALREKLELRQLRANPDLAELDAQLDGYYA